MKGESFLHSFLETCSRRGVETLEDNEGEGSTQKYFFLRYLDSATVVYKVAVKNGKRICGFTVVLKSDRAVRQTGAAVAQPDLSEPL